MQSSPIDSVNHIEVILSSYRGECEHCEVGGIFIMWLFGGAVYAEAVIRVFRDEFLSSYR